LLTIILTAIRAQAQQTNNDLLPLLLKKNLITQAEADSIRASGQSQEKTGIKSRGKLWGVVYTDVIYKAHADSAKRGNLQYSAQPKDSSGLDFRRIFLGYNFDISDRFSSEFILAHETPADVLQSGNRAVFVKAANIRWKNIFPGADLVAGLASTPAVFFASEKINGGSNLWTYRSVERSIADQRKLASSSDAGLLLQGHIGNKGNFGYNFMAANGSGTKPEGDKFKKLYGEVYGKFFNQHLVIDLYSDFERSKLTPYQQSKALFKALIGWQTERFTLGAEALQQLQQNASIYTEGNVVNPGSPGSHKDTVQAVAFGLSFFAKWNLLPGKLAVFARYDYFNPDTRFSKNNFYSASYSGNTVQRFITAGIDYSPAKNVHLIPNIWCNQYEASSDAYNKVHDRSLLQKDYDFVYRLTIYYVLR
ncbi:MAG TPA: hypothetical protein VGO45_13235, partial [Bacteroidia bacterium]|nr:hypothetical protein [Bacteroidia bacterium]